MIQPVYAQTTLCFMLKQLYAQTTLISLSSETNCIQGGQAMLLKQEEGNSAQARRGGTSYVRYEQKTYLFGDKFNASLHSRWANLY
jgi:hypothetical protein